MSQKLCVVVYPQEEDPGAEEAIDDMEEEQHKPIFQPKPAETQDSEEQSQP